LIITEPILQLPGSENKCTLTTSSVPTITKIVGDDKDLSYKASKDNQVRVMISDKTSYEALKDRLDTAGKRFYTCLYLYSTKEPTESLSRVFTTPLTWITLKRNLVPRATLSGTPITPSDTGVRARFHYSLSTWSQHRTIRKLLR